MNIPFQALQCNALTEDFHYFLTNLVSIYYFKKRFIIIHQQMANNERLKFHVGPAYGRLGIIQVLWSQHHRSQFDRHQQPCSGRSQIKNCRVIFE